jgi:hypothetical protein
LTLALASVVMVIMVVLLDWGSYCPTT